MNALAEIESFGETAISPLTIESWQCSAHAPGQIVRPDQLSTPGIEWHSVNSPATAASALQSAGRWNFEQPVDIDAFDWCFRAAFAADVVACESSILHFDGLATEAEVWLNGTLILTADNMFRAYRCDVSSLLNAENELVCIFRSLKQSLAQRRPRPRWKTNLVNHQQLRWHRTSLLGRIPGWAPCAPVVGPWRDVRLERSPVVIDRLRLHTRVDGNEGVICVQGRLAAHEEIEALWLRIAGVEHAVGIVVCEDDLTIEGEIRIAKPQLWWPHTHGEPALYDATLVVDTAAGRYEVAAYKLGFRTLEVDRDAGFKVKINGEPIFCRGACWTTADLLSPTSTPSVLERDLRLARDAGANMIRVGGTMTYESDAFYRLCDELGILVWQDFMFANMDYPVHDAAFHKIITTEATEQITRLAKHACVVVYCGNSEIQQQAAMLGMPREQWSNSWFDEELPALCAKLHRGTHYVPATPFGGALPFQANSGVTHYYGVGAYLRPVSDVRRADVKFTTECLGFANVPDAQTCFEIMAGASPVAHHPRWKARVPRDTGAGWDFEDVRDHYLAELFGVDPVRLRSCDMPRYLQLSRVASGEMMTQAFAEWRSCHSHNSGALVWFFKDLWPAAGWGIIDSHGQPKAAYYALKRAWRTRQIAVTDEGLNGLDIHLTNETSEPISGSLEVTLLREPNTVIACREVSLSVAGRSRQVRSADEILGRFYDVAYAYRFGPPQHDAVVVTWYDERREVLSEAVHFVQRKVQPSVNPTAVKACYEFVGDGQYDVVIESQSFLHHGFLKADGYLPDDNYFHLPPNRVKRVRLSALRSNPPAFYAELEAINLAAPLLITQANSAS